MPWEKYRDTFWTCRNGIRKTKAQMELSLAKDAKNKKKGFYSYIGLEIKIRESVVPLTNNDGEQVMADVEKAEVLKFFASVFTSSQASHISCVP